MTPHCPDCQVEMKLLFHNNYFCPNECDLPPEKRTPKTKQQQAIDSLNKAVDEFTSKKVDPKDFWFSPGPWFYPSGSQLNLATLNKIAALYNTIAQAQDLMCKPRIFCGSVS